MLYQKGNYYHVYNRGCNKLPIFFHKKNYYFLIQKFIDSFEKCEIEISAYCLMPTHYHLLIKQNSNIPVSKWLKTVFNGYTQAINKQENRTGTLFEGRARSKKILDENQLIHLICYIHYNPVQAGLVNFAKDWEFSDYPDWIGIRENKLFNDNILKQYLDSFEGYNKFFNEYIPTLKSAKQYNELLFDAE